MSEQPGYRKEKQEECYRDRFREGHPNPIKLSFKRFVWQAMAAGGASWFAVFL